MMARSIVVFSILATSLFAVSCGTTNPDTAAAPASAEAKWGAVRDTLISEYLETHPVFAVVAGSKPA